MSRNFYTEIVADQDFATMLDGLAFRWFDFGTLAAGASKTYLIYIPDTVEVWFYGRDFAGRNNNLDLNIYANPTFSAQGASMMASRAFNRNGKAPNTPQAQIWQNPTVSDDGGLVDKDMSAGSTDGGGKGGTGNSPVTDFPRVMPPDTYFLVRITNVGNTDSATFLYKLFWNEIQNQ